MKILEGYARRRRQSVLRMEPPQHSGPYCSLPAGFDHIKTWYRLILSGEEEISPITHRGILGACSVGAVVHISGLHLKQEILPRRL